MQPNPPAGPQDNLAFAPVDDVHGLQRVLLLGDSISIGYTLRVRELLKGKANVYRPPENCADSAFALIRVNDWLGDKPWDVIHFNFGLHDVKHLDDKGTYVHPTIGKKVATVEQYKSNMTALINRLKQTNAKLIWCTTTPVAANSLARIEGDELPYNHVAAQIMADQQIPTTDLHAAVRQSAVPIQLPQNVHFTPEGYDHLAQTVAASIAAVLNTSRAKQP